MGFDGLRAVFPWVFVGVSMVSFCVFFSFLCFFFDKTCYVIFFGIFSFKGIAWFYDVLCTQNLQTKCGFIFLKVSFSAF